VPCAIQFYLFEPSLLKIEVNTSKKAGGGAERYCLFAWIVIAGINTSLEHIKKSLRDVMLRDTDISLTQLVGVVCGILLEKWYLEGNAQSVIFNTTFYHSEVSPLFSSIHLLPYLAALVQRALPLATPTMFSSHKA